MNDARASDARSAAGRGWVAAIVLTAAFHVLVGAGAGPSTPRSGATTHPSPRVRLMPPGLTATDGIGDASSARSLWLPTLFSYPDPHGFSGGTAAEAPRTGEPAGTPLDFAAGMIARADPSPPPSPGESLAVSIGQQSHLPPPPGLSTGPVLAAAVPAAGYYAEWVDATGAVRRATLPSLPADATGGAWNVSLLVECDAAGGVEHAFLSRRTDSDPRNQQVLGMVRALRFPGAVTGRYLRVTVWRQAGGPAGKMAP